MQAIISARFLASPDAKPKDKPFEVWDSDLKGFVLRVQPSGARSYLVQVARGRRVTLGTDGALTPATARAMAQKVLGNVAHQLAPLHGLDASTQDSLGEFIEYVYTPWVSVNRPKTADYSLGRSSAASGLGTGTVYRRSPRKCSKNGRLSGWGGP